MAPGAVYRRCRRIVESWKTISKVGQQGVPADGTRAPAFLSGSTPHSCGGGALQRSEKELNLIMRFGAGLSPAGTAECSPPARKNPRAHFQDGQSWVCLSRSKSPDR